MNDDELVEKIAAAMLACEGVPGHWRPYIVTQAARAALQVVKEAGWRPPEKPKLLADVS